MSFDDMTKQEEQEYNKLYKKLPKTALGRARRFILLARKGWSGTRASDSCFEMGDGDAVLHSLLKEIITAPEIKQILINQGQWSPDWEIELEDMKRQNARQIELI